MESHVIGKQPIKNIPVSDDRLSFIYLERCIINIDGGSLLCNRDNISIRIPVNSLITLILGPGANITHAAMKLIGSSGCSVNWMGSDQTRFYAYGRSLSTNARYAIKQAEIVSHPTKRLKAAKIMYSMRFNGDFSKYDSLNRLRGAEGARMKTLYSMYAEQHGIQWNGRIAEWDDISDDDYVNKALTTCNQILYDIEMPIILGLGAVPQLGIIHNGESIAFALDVADVFKSHTSIPVAFEIGSEYNSYNNSDEYSVNMKSFDSDVRALMRKSIADNNVIHDSIECIQKILMFDDDMPEIEWMDDNTGLWDSSIEIITGGLNQA